MKLAQIQQRKKHSSWLDNETTQKDTQREEKKRKQQKEKRKMRGRGEEGNGVDKVKYRFYCMFYIQK